MKSKLLTLGITITAAILVLYKFFSLESLWIDEAYLAKNIQELSYSELFGELPFHNQVSTPLYLIGSKFLWMGLKLPVEIGARLISLISLFVGVFFVFKSLKLIGLDFNISMMLSNILLVSSELTRYACEVKQYELEFAVSAILLFLSLQLLYKPVRTIDLTIYCLFFGFTFFAANTNVILLPFFVLNIAFVFHRDKIKIASWKSASFLIFILFFLLWLGIQYLPNKGSSTDKFMQAFWEKNNAFINLQPNLQDSITELYYKCLVLLDTFSRGFTRSILSVFFIGNLFFASIFLPHKSKFKNLVLYVPIFVYFGLGYLHLYPVQKRLMIFLLPFLILIIGYFVLFITKNISNLRFNHKYFRLNSYFIFPILVFFVCIIWWKTFRNDRYFGHKEHIKPALDYIEKDLSKNDHLYVLNAAYPAFDLYKNRYPNLLIDGTIERCISKFTPDSLDKNQLNHSQSWFLLTHYKKTDKTTLLAFLTINNINIVKILEKDGYLLVKTAPTFILHP